MKITRQENKYMLIYISVKKVCLSANQYADVAELVDAPGSKSKWIFLIAIFKSIDKYTGLGFGRI